MVEERGQGVQEVDHKADCIQPVEEAMLQKPESALTE